MMFESYLTGKVRIAVAGKLFFSDRLRYRKYIRQYRKLPEQDWQLHLHYSANPSKLPSFNAKWSLRIYTGMRGNYQMRGERIVSIMTRIGNNIAPTISWSFSRHTIR